jgi:TonB family protein
MNLRALFVIIAVTLCSFCEAQDVPTKPGDQGADQHASAPDGHPESDEPVESPETEISKSPDSSEIIPGRLVYTANPKYPKQAKKEQLEGIVVVEATIERNGNVGDLAIVSGDVVLADAAVDAIRNWRFEPYTKSGQPVEVHQKLAFNFNRSGKFGELDPQLPPPTFAKSPDPTPKVEEKVFPIGHEVTPPRAIYAPDPPYDEDARKARYQGTSVLSLIVGSDGQPRNIRVTRALGEGLDAKAVESVSKWKFEPATKDGQPVAVYVVIEVQFHLY